MAPAEADIAKVKRLRSKLSILYTLWYNGFIEVPDAKPVVNVATEITRIEAEIKEIRGRL